MRALALALALMACGGSQHPGPPRSTCADAAASMVRGLRAAAPEAAERVAELEPRFAEVCRSSGWRPNIVRCFALARDPAEHRVCARRMPREQRDEARLIQGQLYGPASRRDSASTGTIDERCLQLGPVREGIMLCDRLSPFEQLELERYIDDVVMNLTASIRDPRRLEQIAAECERVATTIRATLAQLGC